jgi:hypothetical protein
VGVGFGAQPVTTMLNTSTIAITLATLDLTVNPPFSLIGYLQNTDRTLHSLVSGSLLSLLAKGPLALEVGAPF